MTTQQIYDALSSALAGGSWKTAGEHAYALLAALADGGAVPSGGALTSNNAPRGLIALVARVNAALE